MDRIRAILYEASLIFLAGVFIACCIAAVQQRFAGPSLESFPKEYLSAAKKDQVGIAERYLRSFTARELIATLDARFTTKQCHTEAHAIGRALYAQGGNVGESIRACGTGCTQGCFHGVLMGLFVTDSDTLGGVINEESADAYLARVEAESKDLCERPEVISVVQARQCHHAIGHVFEYGVQDELSKAIGSCAAFEEPGAVSSCRSGVFMEYLGGIAPTSSAYMKSAAPCDAYPYDLPSCYRNKAYDWLTVWGGVVPAFKACTADGIDRKLCISTTARAAALPKTVTTNEGFERLCGSLEGEEREVCVRGALLKLIDLNEDDTEHVCDSVAPDYRARCIAFRSKISGLMYYER